MLIHVKTNCKKLFYFFHYVATTKLFLELDLSTNYHEVMDDLI